MKILYSRLNVLVLLISICSLNIAESCLLGNSANAQISKDRLPQNLPVRVNDRRISQNSNAKDIEQILVGKWTNNDSTTKGITRVIITKSGNRYLIQAFGKCHPTDCVWGERRLQNLQFRHNVEFNSGEVAAKANYDESFKKETLRISVLNGQMSVLSDVHFIDRSGRPDYSTREYFRKNDAVGSEPAPSTAGSPEQKTPTDGSTSSSLNITGKWVNTDRKTGGITRIIITKSGSRYFIQAFGKCHPTDCIWGERPLKNIQFNSSQATATANYDASFKKETLRLSASGGQITIASNTHFIDGSGRPDFSSRYYFLKDDGVGSEPAPSKEGSPAQKPPTDGSASSSLNIAGSWSSSFGETIFKQSGSIISGTSERGVKGINGRINKNIVKGYWIGSHFTDKNPCSTPLNGSYDWGRFRLVIREDAEAFDGLFGYCNSEPKLEWLGLR